MRKIYPVIMCGGAGTRMWPLSRRAKPKQFHALVTDKSMLQETIARLGQYGALNVAAPSFVCAANDEALVREQCIAEGVSPHKLILEPMGRNTAPVAAVIADVMEQDDDEALILLLPADHHITDASGFWDSVGKGVKSAQEGYLTTLGIHTASPETGYGYIKSGTEIDQDVYAVDKFVEKPDAKTAEIYLRDEHYFWNAGIFLFSAKAMVSAFETHAPDILSDSRKAIADAKTSSDAIWLDPERFADCRAESIDYAIMEKADKVAVIAPVDIGWNDIGSWAAVLEMAADSDRHDSAVIRLDCENSHIQTDGPMVAAIGLKDMVVVATDDAVLVMPAGRAQDVKKVIEQLKIKQRQDLL